MSALKMTSSSHAAFSVLLLIGLLWLPREGAAQNDPIGNCKPEYSDKPTTLCKDRVDFCAELGDQLGVILSPPVYDLSTSCGASQKAFINPTYVCECGALCVNVLEEGEECVGSFSSGYPKALCGEGLDCLMDSSTRVFRCQRNPAKACVSLVIAYEAAQAGGTLGPGLRYPRCDDVGLFAATQCSASATCYCSDQDGTRLFGEAPYTEEATMDCLCARHWLRNGELGLTQGMRCLPNGNLDPLQCNEDFCFCYNSTLGQITQGPYHPSMITLMDCYDPSYHYFNYTNPCTRAEQHYLNTNPEDGNNIVIGSSQKPNCSLDGNYAAVQPRGINFYCSDLAGEQIENFEFGPIARSYSTCYCATRRHLLRTASLTAYLPACCENGNFEAVQKRGLYAYCVDVNGDQDGEATLVSEASSLPCANALCLPSF